MSFNIHAAGTEGFVYSRQGCADRGVFEATAVMSALQATSPSALGVAEGVGDYVLPSVAGDVRDSAQAHGSTIWAQYLKDGLRHLARRQNAAHGGWVSVSAIQSTWGLRRSSLCRTYNFSSHNRDPAPEFMRMVVLPVLDRTDMNNWGVLREIAMSILEYSGRISQAAQAGGNPGPPMLTIQLNA